MRFTFYLPCVLLLWACSIEILAQSSVKELETYLTRLPKLPYESVPAAVFSDNKNESRLLEVLKPHLTDTVKVLRQKSFYLTKRIGQKSKNGAVQETAILMLTRAFREKDTGIQSTAIDALTGFPRARFGASAKDSVAGAIRQNAPHLDELLKLAGYLDLKNQIPAIQTIIQTSGNPKTKWAGRIALARMGNQEAIDYIMNKLQSARVNDDFVYDIVPDLVYTRQPAVFKFLEKIILSDEQACQSANPDADKKILCGYRVMESVAPYIKDFPVKTDDSGDLITDNYTAALLNVRSWFAANTQYQISNDTF